MRQGEIWLINLDPTLGAEIRKTRPCVIMSTDAIGKLPLKVICPITAWSTHKQSPSWMVFLRKGEHSGIAKDSVIDCFQPRAVSHERFVKKLGQVSATTLEAAKQALMLVFDIDAEL